MTLRVHADRNVFVGTETDLITHISAVECSKFAFFEKHVTEPTPVYVLKTSCGGDHFRFLSQSMSRLAQVDAKASWLGYPKSVVNLVTTFRIKRNSQQQAQPSSSFWRHHLSFPCCLVSVRVDKRSSKGERDKTSKVQSVEAPHATLDSSVVQ